MSAPVQSSTTARPATAAATPAAAVGGATELLPSTQTMMQATKLALTDDRAIMLDYYRESAKGTAFLGEDPETKDRILVKSKEEFTSLIRKLYKVGDDFIVLTENSLYIVAGSIQKRKVSMASLQEAYDN